MDLSVGQDRIKNGQIWMAQKIQKSKVEQASALENLKVDVKGLDKRLETIEQDVSQIKNDVASVKSEISQILSIVLELKDQQSSNSHKSKNGRPHLNEDSSMQV